MEVTYPRRSLALTPETMDEYKEMDLSILRSHVIVDLGRKAIARAVPGDRCAKVLRSVSSGGFGVDGLAGKFTSPDLWLGRFSLGVLNRTLERMMEECRTRMIENHHEG